MKKKFLPLLALGALIAASLLPLHIQKAHAVSYYPGYTCYYRDISGACLHYQQQKPVSIINQYGTKDVRPLYGNRQTYPFRAMFNAYSTNQSTWDNRSKNKYNYSSVNPYYGIFPYEDDDDDNNYIDEKDAGYRYYFGKDDRRDTGKWRWYYDEDVDFINPYRYQAGDHYYDNSYDTKKYKYDDDYFEYNRNTYYCTGSDCNDNYYRY